MARILVVDDEPMLRQFMRTQLEMAGHSVREAEDGKQALALCGSDRPDLVITDIIMPNLDGIETIGALNRSHPDVPIIAISGGGRIGGDLFLQLADHLGATRTLAKPFRQEALLEAVNGCLGGPLGDGPEAGRRLPSA